jgi:outer membrane protein OmpA-like peptidoglycan-associated protein
MSWLGQVALLMAVLLGACSPAPAIPKAQSADQLLTINDGPTFYIVFFESGSSRLTATSKHAIVFAVADACRHATTRITIRGHADRAGSPVANQNLSLRRAEAVRREMIKNGVAGDLIVTDGLGETDPMVPTPDGSGNRENRRAEIVPEPGRFVMEKLSDAPCVPGSALRQE